MANEKFARKTAILAKIEAVQGTDSVPTGDANAILASNVTVTPIDGDSVERDNLRPYFGGSGSTMVSFFRKVSFSVEAAGVAAAGTAPAYAALLRACACAVTVEAGVQAVFAPVSDGMESVTIYVSVDGLLHKLTNAMGTVRLAGDAKTLPKFEFEFTGAYSPVTDQAKPVVDYTPFSDPYGINKANTTLSLHGVQVAASAFSFDMGLTVVKRDLINVDSVAITARKSVGSVTFQATPIATKDWVGLAAASTRGPLAFRHGPGASNVIELNGPNVQLGKPTYAEQDGVQMITVPLEYVPTSAGDDEFAIVVR
ncbi:phage tail tube protein [Variovorax sp. UMC13]|uniref:phage tail tube protein n=1 Tax=Variovorax sp. UMC13 TaxID=1862326 RepID=UPI00160116F6|nr:phage tail tube protein [Variovorax sp. UMC13]MBB1601580.1 hypothetical protein [Variovorax sp. UMC13]